MRPRGKANDSSAFAHLMFGPETGQADSIGKMQELENKIESKLKEIDHMF
jgi:hypothetical protein